MKKVLAAQVFVISEKQAKLAGPEFVIPANVT
jgi:hypothetical protein